MSLLEDRPFSVTRYENVDPWQHYESVRAQTPIVWDDELKAWVLLDYATCLEVEMSEARFRNPYQGAPQVVLDIKGGGRNITLLSGDEHMKMRRFFMTLLSSEKIEAYTRNHIRAVVDFLMDRLLARGVRKADLTADFGDQIPPRVILSLLGMPWQDDALVQRILVLHEDLMEVIGGAFRTKELIDKGLKVSAELNDILRPYIIARRSEPKDDLISAVWKGAPKDLGEEMSEADALSICRELFLGGADTTVHGIANINYLLLTDPKIRAAVEAQPDVMLAPAIEESMRLFGSVMYRFRIANEDTQLKGQTIRRDERLILLHSSANRDPAKFGCPHAADLSRKPANDHLAFNKGPRSCLGANLARAEMRVAVTTTLQRLPNVRLDPDAEPPRFLGLFMRSWRPLNVVFD